MIVIPAAGNGSRFREAGYEEPKHLIPLGGVPMVERVSANLQEAYGYPVRVATKDDVGETRGAVETVLRATEGVDPNGPLVVSNCDQLLAFGDTLMLGDGVIFTFPSSNPAHSYVETNDDDLILDIIEKRVISNRAVSGVYSFAEAAPFLEACQRVLDVEYGQELYISSALKVMIDEGFLLYAVDAPTAILGTPEDFQRFEVALRCAS